MKGSGINLFCYEGRDERTGSTGYFHIRRIPAGPGPAPAFVRRQSHWGLVLTYVSLQDLTSILYTAYNITVAYAFMGQRDDALQ